MNVIAFSGGRSINKAAIVEHRIAGLLDNLYWLHGPHINWRKDTHWVFGDARGLDAIVWDIAKRGDISHERLEADWATHGASAGPKRNTEILKREPQLLIAFPAADSIGTWDMIMQTAARNKQKTLFKTRIEIIYV